MTHVAWRLTKEKYRDTTFSGYGAMLHGGRWHSKGTAVVYTADSPALALLETMVHIEDADLLNFDYVAVPIRFKKQHLTVLDKKNLPDDWNAWPWPKSAREFGMQWIEERRSVVLQVPSAIVPYQANYLINPAHPEFSALEVGPAEAFPVDSRLIKQR